MTERVRNGWRTVFAWDGFNRMTAATDHSGITTTFSYDALGRRLSKSSGDTTTLFGWDGDVLACDHLGTPQELTDHERSVAWSAQYKAWGGAGGDQRGWEKGGVQEFDSVSRAVLG